MEFISKEINQYCLQFTTEQSDIAREIKDKTNRDLKYSNMLSGKMIGQLLATLVRVSACKKVLEVGTFTGYSALRMAEALPEDGSLITCDYNERYAEMARSSFDKSDHGHKITLKLGKALDTLKTVDADLDFIFLDADKANYPAYYKMLLPKLNRGRMLAVDNVLWSGKVLEPRDRKSKAIDELNQMIAEDNRVEQVMLPVRDGITIVRKK